MRGSKQYVLAAGGTGGHMVPAAALATELTATASVGASTAPRAKAMASGMATAAAATAPTARVVATTRPTARARTGRLTLRRSRNDDPSASPKTSGARIATRIVSPWVR